MKKIYLLTLLPFLLSTGFSQNFYQKTIRPTSQPYGYVLTNSPYLAKQTFDKGIIFTSNFYKDGYNTGLMKLNAAYAVEWAVKFSMNIVTGNGDFYPLDIIQTKDSGYVVTGVFTHSLSTDAGYIVKFSKKGRLLWEKYVQGNSFTWACSVSEDRTGNLFVSGKSDVGAPTNASDIWVMKLNRSGDILLNKTYHINGVKAYENKIVNSKDNGFVVVAKAGGNMVLLKADTLGIPVFTKIIGEQLNPYSAYKMKVSESGNRDVTVVATNNSGGVVAFQTTSLGNVKWSKTLTGATSLSSNDLLQLSPTGNFLVSALLSGVPNQIIGIKLDNSSGDVSASMVLKNTVGTIFNFINKISPSEYSLTGWDAAVSTNYISILNFDSSLQSCSASPATITAADNTLAISDGTTTSSTTVSELSLTLTGTPWGNATTVASVCDVLPLNLISFTLSKNGNTNLLKWSTAQEINTSYFEIQRSNDGRSFAAIGKLNAAGKATLNDYQFADASPLGGTNYYRLKIADKDGKVVYSPIVWASNTNTASIIIYPIPVKDKITIKMTTLRNNIYNVAVTDMQGRVIIRTTFNADAGTTVKEINAAALKQGTYFVRIQSEDGLQVIKIVR